MYNASDFFLMDGLHQSCERKCSVFTEELGDQEKQKIKIDHSITHKVRLMIYKNDIIVY